MKYTTEENGVGCGVVLMLAVWFLTAVFSLAILAGAAVLVWRWVTTGSFPL